MSDLDQLPPGWALTTLGEVCSRIRDGSHNPPERTEIGLPMLSAKDIQDGTISFDSPRLISPKDFEIEDRRTEARAGDVLLTIVGTVGRSCVVGASTPPFTLQRSVAALRPMVDPEFLSAHLRTNETQTFLTENAKGTAQKGIYLKTLGTTPVRTAPLPEQKRIVDKIEALQARSDAAKEALDAIPPLLEKFRQSVLAAAFRGDLTRTWREQHPDVEPASELLKRIRAERRRKWEEANPKKKYVEPEPVDASGLPELPKGWCWASLDHVCALVQDGNYGELYPKQDEWVEAGVPFLTGAAFGADGTILVGKLKFITAAKQAELAKAQTRPGDIVFPNRGARDGQTSGAEPLGLIIPESMHVANINPQLTLLRPLSGAIDSRFMRYALSSPSFLQQFRAVTTGSALRFINLAATKRMRIPLPPIGEQLRITRRVDEQLSIVDSVFQRCNSATEYLASLNQSILAKAFRGELVPQDPNDEPASVLLERIKRGRETGGDRVKRGRKAAKSHAD